MKKKLIFEIETDNYPTWDGTGYTPWDGTGYIVLSLDKAKELIECKDCTHSREIKPFGATELCCMCWGLFAVEPNGYCDRAERKKNER